MKYSIGFLLSFLFASNAFAQILSGDTALINAWRNNAIESRKYNTALDFSYNAHQPDSTFYESFGSPPILSKDVRINNKRLKFIDSTEFRYPSIVRGNYFGQTLRFNVSGEHHFEEVIVVPPSIEASTDGLKDRSLSDTMHISRPPMLRWNAANDQNGVIIELATYTGKRVEKDIFIPDTGSYRLTAADFQEFSNSSKVMISVNRNTYKYISGSSNVSIHLQSWSLLGVTLIKD